MRQENISSIREASLFFVNALTSGTTKNDTVIAATPISGEYDAATLKLELSVITSVEIPTVNSPAIIPENAPIFVIFFENRPQIYGPIKHPETTPQENDIKLTIIGIFCVAKMNEQATNARQKRRVINIWFSLLNDFPLSAGMKSTATADADVKTTDWSVDIDAERSNTIIIASNIKPKLPPPNTFINSVGITESIPPSGSVPSKTSLEVLPIKYAPHPITVLKIVDMTVPLLIAAVSFIA